MPSVALRPHPSTLSQVVASIIVNVARAADARLALDYSVTGDIGRLCLPAARKPKRTDELWRHTCFEAFVKREDGAYFELNFAPSGEWAVYRFGGYRDNMSVMEDTPPPCITLRSGPSTLQLKAEIDLASLAGIPRTGALRLALSTVIEETSGRLSYWAVTHPVDKPDFHHADGFSIVHV